LYPIAIPSVVGSPPGNCAYPSNPPPRFATQKLKYKEVSHASFPPAAVLLRSSLVPQEAVEVEVLVIPFVGLPSGSI